MAYISLTDGCLTISHRIAHVSIHLSEEANEQRTSFKASYQQFINICFHRYSNIEVNNRCNAKNYDYTQLKEFELKILPTSIRGFYYDWK